MTHWPEIYSPSGCSCELNFLIKLMLVAQRAISLLEVCILIYSNALLPICRYIVFFSITVVLVTGATGYLASHIVKQLVDSEQYRVRGTVRSLEGYEKLEKLKSLLGDNCKYPAEFVEADLTKPESWTEYVLKLSALKVGQLLALLK